MKPTTKPFSVHRGDVLDSAITRTSAAGTAQAGGERSGELIGRAYTLDVVRRYEERCHSVSRIALDLGSNKLTVSRILQNAGVELVPRGVQQQRCAVKLYRQGLGKDAIAGWMEITGNHVVVLLRRAGIEPAFVRSRCPVTPETVAQICRLYHDDGMSLAEIARYLHRSKSVVGRALQRAGVPMRAAHAPARDRQELADLFRQGLEPPEIAEKVGLSVGSVRRYLSEAGIPLGRRNEQRDRDVVRRFTVERQSTEQIASEIGIARKAVAQVLANRGVDTERETLERGIAQRLKHDPAYEVDPVDLERLAPLPEGRGSWVRGVVTVYRDDGIASMRVDYRHRDRAIRVLRLDPATGFATLRPGTAGWLDAKVTTRGGTR